MAAVVVVRVLLAVTCVLWLVEAAVFVKHATTLRTLARLSPPEPLSWPRVSIVIAARDEAAEIGTAVRSRLDDYPDLEVIAVDDRSTDGTGEILDAIAEQDARVKVVHVRELPAGWLGKVHALDAGAKAATGEFLLFTDADVHMTAGAMRRVVAVALNERLDMVALLPEYRSNSFLVETMWTTFLRTFCLALDFRDLEDTTKATCMGSGAFNLVRREVFERTPGFEWLKLETADDMGLGMMMKRAGSKSACFDGSGSASVLIYPDLAAYFRGTEKNGGTIIGPGPLAFLAFVCVYAAVELGPLAAVFASPAWLRWLGAVALGAAYAVNVYGFRRNTGRVLPSLFWPLGSLIFAVTLLRAYFLARKRGGIVWRDTFYTNEEILAGRRYTFKEAAKKRQAA